MRRLFLVATASMCLPLAMAAQQLTPPSTGGVGALDRALGRLTNNRRVLVIAAHPDDEDTELLTFLSRAWGVDAAYLSLSRGEGGQNLIGSELGEALGLIRTGELLAARSVDGAHQFFTRGFDFGFSKSLSEADRFWPRDTMLTDVVRVIRRFRPQVLVAIFGGTPRDGHGQHQQSGVLARQAFELLRDSAWGPKKFYRGTRFVDTALTTLRIPSGLIDPDEGKSYLQIAMAGRSLHRSQDMGQLQRLGASTLRLGLIERADGRAGPDGGLFEGIDTSLAPGLSRYAALVDSARGALRPRAMDALVPVLGRALTELRAHAPADFLASREPILEGAIAVAAGMVVDAAADDNLITPGQPLHVTVGVWNAGPVRSRVVEAGIDAPPGWTVAPGAAPAEGQSDPIRAGLFATTGVEPFRFVVAAPADAPASEPYFLERPRIGALYDWSSAPDSLKGEALDPPLLTARVRLDVGGVSVTLRREVSWRFVDQASGEVRRPIAVVPAVWVDVSPDVLVWPVSASEPRTISVELTNGARAPTNGELTLELPGGWPEVAPQRFALEEEGTRRSYSFEVRAPRNLAPGAYEIHAVATANGRRYDRGTVVLDYPHIRPMTYTKSATVRVEAAALALPRLARVGYIRGAADEVPENLRAVGLPITVLGAAELERGDLSQYDAIVIGSRAYEVDPALIANNGRLLDYARAGGRLIVQYQQYQFIQGNFAPFPLTIARPHDRVTDENAPVRLLAPDHPLFTTPNRIGEADWAGWVQERGLYFAHTWDPAYRPLLELGDSVQDARERLQGGLLVAHLGRGLYVYTGISFFRQLPAGVSGAYRLFVNLLGLDPSAVP
jgi:LmbE family N-acetylglucosaminyl deacetylase